MSKIELLKQLQNLALCGEDLESLMLELADAESLAELANTVYRAGEPIIEDWFYDQYLIEALKIVNPESEFLQQVEPEPIGVFGKTVELPERMLSTRKAYSVAEIEKWAENVLAVGQEIGLPGTGINFKVTPKLDGFAAYDDGKTFYTRGNGVRGTDITRAFDRGLRALTDPYNSELGSKARGFGKGEIVVKKSYFEEFLADKYENSRNVIAAVIKEGALDKEIQTAIEDGAVVFAPFSKVDSVYLAKQADLSETVEKLWEQLVNRSFFDADGLVFESTSLAIKSKMGSTNHHHRWQIAYKRNTEFHDIRVTGLTWQTGKSGKITPVVELEPTKVSGVTISRATGHHYGNVLSRGIGPGATVRVCRSGQVIPYIADVVEAIPYAASPMRCPSCNSPTEIRGDFLHCTNESTCPAQVERTIEHFFKTIGNCDGFGPSIVGKLVAEGIDSVSSIYAMSLSAFEACDVGSGIAANLCAELTRSQNEQIEDWRFLAAFSIPSVGKGGCEKLLKHHRIEDIFSLTVDDIVRIDGFAEKTASVLVETLRNIKPQFDRLFPLFNLKRTEIGFDAIVDQMKSGSPIAGKTIVFTGAMQKGSRDQMEKEAKLLGAKVGSSVSGKTDYLVAGLNVGANKTAAARKHGVKVLSEDEYLQLIEP